jgi:serine/threonine-protein kinase RsbW
MILATPEAIEELRGLARQWLEDNGLAARRFATDLLLCEGLNNAMIHGCGDDPTRTIACELRRGRKWFSITIDDGGPGFDWAARQRHCARPQDDSGRGLSIYRLYADEVKFNRPGSQVVLRCLLNSKSNVNHTD